jgi:hypothetical protein
MQAVEASSQPEMGVELSHISEVQLCHHGPVCACDLQGHPPGWLLHMEDISVSHKNPIPVLVLPFLSSGLRNHRLVELKLWGPIIM